MFHIQNKMFLIILKTLLRTDQSLKEENKINFVNFNGHFLNTIGILPLNFAVKRWISLNRMLVLANVIGCNNLV